MMKKKPYKDPRKRLRKEADDLFQEWGRKTYRDCLTCGDPMDCLHHYITKGASSHLRYDEENGIPICNSCHCKIHRAQDPTMIVKIYQVLGKEWYDRIEEKKIVIIKTNVSYLRSVIEDLKEKILVIENG